jgi:hypothetical protein
MLIKNKQMAARGRGPLVRWTNLFRLLDSKNKGTIEACDATAVTEVQWERKWEESRWESRGDHRRGEERIFEIRNRNSEFSKHKFL